MTKHCWTENRWIVLYKRQATHWADAQQTLSLGTGRSRPVALFESYAAARKAMKASIAYWRPKEENSNEAIHWRIQRAVQLGPAATR